MIPTLLFISFMMHIVLLVIIWQLSKQVKTLKDNQPHDIMKVFETYLQEVREENRMLENQLAIHQPKKEDENVEAVELLKRGEASHPSEENRQENKSTQELQDIPSTDPTDEAKAGSDVALSLEANVLHLYSQGYSVEEIARELKKGRTEVMLIVKFHKEN